MLITRLIETCAKNRFLVLFLSAVMGVVGWYAYRSIPIDAIPDLSDTQVVVYSSWDVSPDIIEDQVTYPIVTSLLGVPNVRDIRGISTFGSSFVYVIFEDGTDIYWARSRVLEYLSKTLPTLPDAVKTELGPDATGVGWVYQYALRDTTGKHSLADLRSLQDWFLRFQLQSVAGVAEVAAIGGFEKQYQIEVNPNALRAYGISLQEVVRAVREGNNEMGARLLEMSGTEYMIRARGYAKSRQDIESIVIGSRQKGVPVYIKNVARVVIGPQLRQGVADLNGEGDSVGGIIVMRHGANANEVIGAVKDKLESLKTSLPEGVEIVETYDRSDLIGRSVDTLYHELAVELAIVALVIIAFLLHAPSAFVPIVALPLAVVISFIPMYLMGVSANIMSLGGIAIAIGAMVDASLIVVENAYKRLEEARRTGSIRSTFDIVVEAVKEVGPASFYSLLVISVSFLPIFALEEQEGRLFKPLAYTKTFAMAVAAVLSVTLVPALLVIVHRLRTRRPLYPEEKHPISSFLFRIYTPVIHWVVRHPWKVVGGAVLALILTIPAYLKIGSEFMPPLNEGSILYMPTTLPGISIGEAQKLLQTQDQILAAVPEVKTVFGKVGRAETSTDPAPLSMMETVITLKPTSEWPRRDRWYSFLPGFLKAPMNWFWPEHATWDELISELDEKLKIPGTVNAWTMPIKARIDMLSTGIRTPVGIKIYGNDLKTIEKTGLEIESVLQEVAGTRSVFSERVTGGFFLDIHFNREALARYGISIGEAQETLRHALGGATVSTAIQGRERYSINVRYARGFRSTPGEIEGILLSSPERKPVPLGEVARLEVVSGPGMIRTENGMLAAYLYVDTSDNDLGGYVDRAREAVESRVKLPAGTSLEWTGQYESLARVRDRLAILVPIALVIIFLLVYRNTRSIVETGIVFLAIPFSAIGAVWLLYLLDYQFSIAVWVGIIALLGVDAETAIFMLLYLTMAHKRRTEEGKMQTFADLEEAVHDGAVKRIRPKMMTVATTFLALFPILLAPVTQAGADVMKRMAAPMVGGILTSFLLELIVYPAIFVLWKRRGLKGE